MRAPDRKKYGLLLTEQAVPVLFTNGPRRLLRSNRAFCHAAGHYACHLFIGSTLQVDLDGIKRTFEEITGLSGGLYIPPDQCRMR